MKSLAIFGAILTLALSACQRETAPKTRFSLLPAAETGVDFRNDLTYTDSFNCYVFRNFYNGGGTGAGDLNNDGLPDLFFCGNQVSNRLYLNRGNFKFEDITEKTGLASAGVWSSGVALADVNADGWLDIYVCKSGNPNGPRRRNELFLNNGDAPKNNGIPTFTENANTWGLDFQGLSTHAAFFDYDLDGDLDCYLLNNSLRSVGGYDFRPGQRDVPDPEGGNKLLRNDGDRFSDVTAASGIYSSAIGFGLGVTVGDVDADGWPDIFVSNDYFERDYLYRNNHDGTFTDIGAEAMPEMSKGSMGADMADLNNDARPEIFVTEMTPEGDARYKTKATFDNWNTFRQMQDAGYHRQFGRNVLQLNTIDGASVGSSTVQRPTSTVRRFAEIGRFAGVATTDWSWGALLADFDNDGWKDIFVANGIGKDLLDQDYLNFYADPAVMRQFLRDNPGEGIKKLIDQMPSEAVPNYLFKNRGGTIPTFQNVAAEWGLAQPSFSNGSAYADFDNDGDLDLVVNNVNAPAFIYRNGTSSAEANWLKINVKGNGNNTAGIGTKVFLHAAGQVFYQEIYPMRGFESCVDARPNFGLGKLTAVDTVRVVFPSGRVWEKTGVAANQILQVNENEAVDGGRLTVEGRPAVAQIFSDVPEKLRPDFRHVESQFSDFDREPLLFQMFSAEGPCLAVADANGDGREDFYIGGASGQAGKLFFQNADGSFRATQQPDFERDKICEDVAAAFFDADGDGDLDLYVGAGSNEFRPGDPGLQDRLYLNDGHGNFRKKADGLPSQKPVSTACVRPADVDGDGDQDVFVGFRMLPGNYGQPVGAMILENDGSGRFSPAVQKYPALAETGMVTDASWADFDTDGDADLLVVGEWEQPHFFQNDGGQLTPISPLSGGQGGAGWWNCLRAADLDDDGDVDFVLGNHGLNSRFRASAERPISLWLNDFDGNSWNEPIIAQFNGDKSYPLVLRPDLVRQMPGLKKKYLKFDSYKNQTMQDIFTQEQLAKAYQREATFLQSAIVWNRGGGKFELEALPAEAQLAPVYAIEIQDFTGDGKPDILLGGNHERCKPETGTYLALHGLLVENMGGGRFVAVSADKSGLSVDGCIRSFSTLKTGGKRLLLVAKNDAPMEVLRW